MCVLICNGNGNGSGSGSGIVGFSFYNDKQLPTMVRPMKTSHDALTPLHIEDDNITSSWREGFEDELKKIETEEFEMATSRRNLVKTTKEMKQLSLEEQFSKFPDLLKLYQLEIDSLCNRVKNVHSSYRKAIHAIESTTSSPPSTNDSSKEGEFDQLRDTLAQLQQQNKTLNDELTFFKSAELEFKSQYQQLQDELESSLKENKDLKVTVDSMKRIKNEYDERGTTILELQNVMAQQEKQIMLTSNRNEELIIELAKVKKAYEDILQKHANTSAIRAQEESIKMVEIDVVKLNLDNVRQQLVEVQCENESLKAELSSLKTLAPSTNYNELRIRELEEEIVLLQGKIEENIKESMISMDLKDQEISSLKGKIDSYKYVDLKLVELKKFKAAEFSDLYDPIEDQSLEVLLQQKNKCLEADIVTIRMANRDLESQLGSLKQELSTGQKKIGELESIISRFENATITSDPVSIKSGSSDSLVQVNDSFVVILTNQRDRLKRHNRELEEKLQKSQLAFENQKSEVYRLQSDNRKLFEKIKFLENIRTKPSVGGENIDSELGELLHQYQPAYEDKLDPFRLFFRNEIVKRFKTLGQTDKIVWKLGRIFLTNKFIRRFMAIYFLALHLFLIYYIFWRSSRVGTLIH